MVHVPTQPQPQATTDHQPAASHTTPRSQLFSVIRKRDQRLVPFAAEKITNAIHKAGEVTGELGPPEARRLTMQVLAIAQNFFGEQLNRSAPAAGDQAAAVPSVEEIQDLVEEVLLSSPYKKTAKAYILYRDQHARIREMVTKTDLDLIDGYLQKLDWQVQENSNMSYSLQGLNNYVSSEISKNYWLNKIYPAEVRRAHLDGDLHLHDLGQLSVYCVGWDLRDLLKQGFTGAPGKAESGPAKHFRSALGQIVNFFYTLQGEAAGAQAFASFDTLLAPFIRADNLNYREVKQALQEFVFNLNVPTRVGFQTPFTNLTMDLQPPSALRQSPVIIGGVEQDGVYGDYQQEMNLLNQAFLEVMAEGDSKGRAFTFPIPTYNITADFNWDDPSLDRLWQTTARYGLPYFANFVNSDMSPDDARSMCCRLRLDTRELEKRGGGLFGANPLTGSIGVVTINMAALGYQTKDEADFFQRLEKLMQIARTSLETKRKVLENFTAKGLYPYTRYYLRQVEERFGRFWDNHFSTIGLIGTNEACLNLLGEDIGSPAGKAFALRVLDFMRQRLSKFQEETGNQYNLEATPAEGTGHRLAKLDARRFPELAATLTCCEEGRLPIYTNSTQLPVNYTEDIFQLLDHQDELQAKYTGGTVVHCFLGETEIEAETVKSFVKTVCSQYQIPYFTLTPVFAICPQHGYLAGEQHRCPHCQATTEVYSRVVGYLRPIQQWHEGKQAEFTFRNHYRLSTTQP
ncbi:ribonucleoside triphosphate reductase [Desulfurivibrio alkaliphilus]|uniref:Anaerobic ribonucleoside-triphosphate reductase n=1 Tax=Desulfurivibrio alkaliphilus (strain DSM 19089 / UNIQEM U267 / AHT2) TaxID=589865 RepID=D6Z3Y1_DESAT|nr:ribonucleoside triphosphate reductase [Desulfurivibrio alkaliphilus]ADH86256.1 anaerobic ribonucleoside-triphosphate reductase [Desulfurivibrio alkaliphilus AHT 2]